MTAWIMLAGLAVEALLGWPDALDRRMGHPVRWFGWLVERAEHLGNREKWSKPARGAMGGLLTLFLLVVNIPVRFVVMLQHGVGAMEIMAK